MPRQYTRSDPFERLLSKFEVAGTCWLYTGAIDKVTGYGKIKGYGKQLYAHRVSYAGFVGPIPEGLHLDHVKALGCGSRACINPDHLEPVTPQENLLRGDTWNARNASRSYCPQGHPYSPENTYVPPNGVGRSCRACSRIRGKAYQPRRNARKRERRREQRRAT